jgi:hypothetical protein
MPPCSALRDAGRDVILPGAFARTLANAAGTAAAVLAAPP